MVKLLKLKKITKKIIPVRNSTIKYLGDIILLQFLHFIFNIKKETIEKQVEEEIKKVEQEIEILKKGAPEKINKIAIETSSELVKKLIGAEINNSSISAIVDDLSKKNGNKYYGN